MLRRYLVAGFWCMVFCASGWAADAEDMDSVQGNAGAAETYLQRALQAQSDRNFDTAQKLFEQYIALLPKKDQSYFRDILLVATRAELDLYKKASEDEQDEMIARFWNRYDPSPLTPENEHLIEHYRRVAYAREHFGKGRFPWDDRGDVYIRFGAPDHISWSGDIQAEMDRDIQDARQDFVNRKRLALRVVPGQPIFPVPQNTRWEYWVYVHLDHGTEFTFVSRFRNKYEFAQIPDGLSVSLISDLMAYQGEVIVRQIASRQPAVYETTFADLPVDFFYYPAGFRGEGEDTRLELYYGLPASEMARLPSDEQTDLVMLDRGVALYDSLWNEVHRTADQLSFRTPSDQQILDRAFIPGVLAFHMAPGPYRMAFQIRDVVSGKSRVYQQEIVLEDFSKTASLQMSDIELAFWVSETEETGPFVKRGLQVIPMSSRAFRADQNAFVYFEIYNLAQDAFGQSKYRVEYTFRSFEKRAAPARVLRGLGRALRLSEKDREVVASYQQTGSAREERAYVELDLKEADPGGQKVRVTVTDLLTDASVSKEITFRIDP